MWHTWQRGETDASRFYEDFYKKSAVKTAIQTPSAREYTTALRTQGLLGNTSAANVENTGSGYPIELELENKKGKPAGRVYLNPHPRHVAEVYRFVKEHIHPLPGVIWAKLADHARAMTVRDVIVVYLSSADEHAGTEGAVIGLLSDYQAGHRGHFVDEVPRLTAPRLPGVGVGAEPPTSDALGVLLTEHLEKMGFEERQHHVSQAAQFSFSTYRSTLVVRAIEDAGGVGGQVEDFQLHVADYFARAGIDPADPTRQGPPDPSVLPLLGMVRKKTEEEKEHS